MRDKFMKRMLSVLYLCFISLAAISYYAYNAIKADFPAVPIETKKVWDSDSTHFFMVNRYSLGVFGGGYTLISIDCDLECAMRFDGRSFLKGEWVSRDTISLIVQDLPVRKVPECSCINIKIFVNDYKKDKSHFLLIPYCKGK